MEKKNIGAPFLTKMCNMVSDPHTDPLISWGPNNNSFVVANPYDFADRVLPAYFKHKNFFSFVRQVNHYGFRKVSQDRWEFANESFLRGQEHLLKNISRPDRNKTGKSDRTDSDAGLPASNLAAQVDKLRRERATLISTIVLLRLDHKALDEKIKLLNKRLQKIEKSRQQMLVWLSLMNNPAKEVSSLKGKRKAVLYSDKRLVLKDNAATDGSFSSLKNPLMGEDLIGNWNDAFPVE